MGSAEAEENQSCCPFNIQEGNEVVSIRRLHSCSKAVRTEPRRGSRIPLAPRESKCFKMDYFWCWQQSGKVEKLIAFAVHPVPILSVAAKVQIPLKSGKHPQVPFVTKIAKSPTSLGELVKTEQNKHLAAEKYPVDCKQMFYTCWREQSCCPCSRRKQPTCRAMQSQQLVAGGPCPALCEAVCTMDLQLFQSASVKISHLQTKLLIHTNKFRKRAM